MKSVTKSKKNVNQKEITIDKDNVVLKEKIIKIGPI